MVLASGKSCVFQAVKQAPGGPCVPTTRTTLWFYSTLVLVTAPKVFRRRATAACHRRRVTNCLLFRQKPVRSELNCLESRRHSNLIRETPCETQQYLRHGRRSTGEHDAIPLRKLLPREIFQDANRRRDRTRAVRGHRRPNAPCPLPPGRGPAPAAPPSDYPRRHLHERCLSQRRRRSPRPGLLAGSEDVPGRRRDREVARAELGDALPASGNLPEAFASSDKWGPRIAGVRRRGRRRRCRGWWLECRRFGLGFGFGFGWCRGADGAAECAQVRRRARGRAQRNGDLARAWRGGSCTGSIVVVLHPVDRGCGSAAAAAGGVTRRVGHDAPPRGWNALKAIQELHTW